MVAADSRYVARSAGEDWDAGALADMLVQSLTHLVEAAGASLLTAPAEA